MIRGSGTQTSALPSPSSAGVLESLSSRGPRGPSNTSEASLDEALLLLSMRLRDLKGRLPKANLAVGRRLSILMPTSALGTSQPPPLRLDQDRRPNPASIGNHCTRINDSGH